MGVKIFVNKMSKFSEANFYKFLIISFILAFILPFFVSLAQDEICNTKEECEALLEKYEEEIKKLETAAVQEGQKAKTLRNQISALKNKINQLELEIRKGNIIIQDLTLQIQDTESSIKSTSQKIENSRIKLAQILRTIYEEDQKGLIEILLSENDLSGFFNNLMALEALDNKNQELLENIKGLKTGLEKQKQSLDEEKEDLERMLKIHVLQKEESAAIKKEQEKLLDITKGKESEYQKMLAATKKRATEIKARIFELIGVPKAPTFGEALEVAKYVEKITGIRSAFLLAVIEQESDLGKNVGQCYLKNPQTGSGVVARNGASVSKVMNPTRDVPHFLKICQELGKDPYKTLVSCPMSFGWGGAMGPAQFIPSTWILYRERVKAITGKSADPWDIRDSFLAAGLYLADYGAAAQTKNAEWKAAMIYFSGTTNSKYKFYGNSVLNRAERIEDWIKAIEKVS